MAVLQSDNSSINNASAGLVTLLDEMLCYIITCKELEALKRGEIGEQEAVKRIAASLALPFEHIAAPLHAIRGLVPTLPSTVLSKHLNNFFIPCVLRGKAWLQQNARRLLNQIEGSGIFEDTFSQFLVMEATNDTSLLHLHPYKDLEANEDIRNTMTTAKRWNYFLGEAVGTTERFPADVDTTSYSLLAFTPTSGIHDVLDDMLANRNDDGLVQTYWDKARPRIDICVLTNVVRAFYKYGRYTDIKDSLAYISNALDSETYMTGTRHYCTPEEFLFFMSQLVADHPHAAEIQHMRKSLINALIARVGIYENQVTQAELDLARTYQAKGEKYEAYVPEVDCLAITMRILACQSLEIRPEGIGQDIERLASLQCEDGGWPLAWLCRYGRSKLRIGNRGVVTAYAVKALEVEARSAALIGMIKYLDVDEHRSEQVGEPVAAAASQNVGFERP